MTLAGPPNSIAVLPIRADGIGPHSPGHDDARKVGPTQVGPCEIGIVQLGVGGNWLTYTAQVNSAAPYGVGLRGAIVSVDGQEYTGTLALVTTGTLILQGYGQTLHTITIQPYDGMQLAIAPDPLTTVPWGPVASPPSQGGARGGSLDDGRALRPPRRRQSQYPAVRDEAKPPYLA
jgi:hypothetical protein